MSTSGMDDSLSDWWEEADTDVSPEEENELDRATYKLIDRSMKNIWKNMKKMESDLDSLSRKKGVSVEQSPAERRKNMDNDDLLLSFPLTDIDDVIELESRLLNGSSDFKEDFIKYITPECCNCLSDIKYFMGLLLRRLFTNKFANNYSWRGYRGNFKIGNLKVVKIIFDITRSKYKNVTKQEVNLLIKEWIKYAKQRYQLKKKIKKEKRKKRSSV